LAGLNLWRHQSNVVNVCRTANVDHVGNIPEVQIVIAANEHDALGAIRIDLGQLRL
jgi:hypothetical protein